MAQDPEGLPATTLLLAVVALLLFGAGGGLVGHVAGERQGERRAELISQTLGGAWDQHRQLAKRAFDEAIGDAGAQLEDAAAGLRAQVSMYHGCGAICATIASQFSAELLRARGALRAAELTPLPDWQMALQQDNSMAASNGSIAGGTPLRGYSGATVIIAVGLLCATAALCFGIACLTLLKLRAAGGESA